MLRSQTSRSAAQSGSTDEGEDNVESCLQRSLPISALLCFLFGRVFFVFFYCVSFVFLFFFFDYLCGKMIHLLIRSWLELIRAVSQSKRREIAFSVMKCVTI